MGFLYLTLRLPKADGVGFPRKRYGMNRLRSIFVHFSWDYYGVERFSIAFEKPLNKWRISCCCQALQVLGTYFRTFTACTTLFDYFKSVFIPHGWNSSISSIESWNFYFMPFESHVTNRVTLRTRLPVARINQQRFRCKQIALNKKSFKLCAFIWFSYFFLESSFCLFAYPEWQKSNRKD